MTRLTALGLAFAFAAAVVACGGSSGNTSSITTPSGNLITETFSGTVPVGGQDFKPFTVTTGGTVSITLVSAGPPPTITMGLGIGTPSSAGVCALLSGGSTLTTAGSTAQLTGTVAAGTYCVEVLDVGNAAGPIAYTVTVAHT